MDPVRNIIIGEIQKWETIIRQKEQALKKAPDGRLRVSTCHNSPQYYHVTDNTKSSGIYLRKDKEKLIAALAQKQYDQKVLEEAGRRLDVLLKMNAAWPGEDMEQFYQALHEGRRAFVTPVTLPDDLFLRQWIERPYEKGVFRPEEQIYHTNNEELVRSKSEAMIANRLLERGIPYKYECRLILPDSTWMLPDFTILNMRRREELYYEHFGRMDDAGYVNRNLPKIQDYQRNGIFLGDRLFVTFETERRPFDPRDLDLLIDKFFL